MNHALADEIAEAIALAQKHNPWPTAAERVAAALVRKTIATNVQHVLTRRISNFDAQRFQRKTCTQRLHIGKFPAGLVYVDTSREKHGDYARLAFLSYATLKLDIERDCPADLREEIVAHAATLQARAGEEFEVSQCGQTVLLGSALPAVQQQQRANMR
jgi:hypothetical protein